jgi:hypothetical protein
MGARGIGRGATGGSEAGARSAAEGKIEAKVKDDSDLDLFSGLAAPNNRPCG